MDVEMLVVADCANHAEMERRVRAALHAVGADVGLRTRVIDDLEDAEAAGMHGSPTLLIDGGDPFAVAGTVASISCRPYRSEHSAGGLPSEQAIAAALARHLVR